MPLQKSTVPISFKSALNTKPDPKSLVVGELTVAENVTFDEGMAFRLRNGFKLIGNQPANAGISLTLVPGQISALATFKSELLAFDGFLPWSYVEAQNFLIPIFPSTGSQKNTLAPSVTVTDTAVVRSGYQQKSADSAISTVSGYQMFAWEDQYSAGVRYSLIDTATGKSLANSVTIGSNGIGPKVVYYNGFFCLFWLAGDGLHLARFDETNLNNPPITTLVEANVSETYGYDVAIADNAIYVGSNNTSTGFVLIQRINPSFVVDASITLTTSDIGFVAISIFGNPTTPTGDIYVATSGAGGVWLTAVNQLLTSQSNTQLYSTAIVNGSITGCVEGLYYIPTSLGLPPENTTGPTVYWTIPDPNSANPSAYPIPQDAFLNTLVMCSTNFGAAFVLNRSVGLASKATQHSTVYLEGSLIYVGYAITAYQSQYQTTYFMQPSQTGPVAKIFPNTAGGLPARFWALPAINQLDANTLQVALLEQEQLSVEQGVLYAPTGVNSVVLEFGDIDTQFSHSELGNNLMIGGGFPQMYDGANFVEHNFHVFPEGMSVLTAPLGGAVGGLDGTYYQYSSIYQWTDNQGQIHQSAPSIPIAASNQATNPMYTAGQEGTDNLGSFSFGGAVGVGSTSVVTGGVLYPSAFEPDKVFPGCTITDSGGAIPIGTYITAVLYNTPVAGTTTLTISQPATASFAVDTLTVSYSLTRLGTVGSGSNIVQMGPLDEMYAYGLITSGSPVIQMFSLDGMAVGLSVSDLGSLYFPSGTLVTAVNYFNNTITVNNNATATSAYPSAISFRYLFTGTGTGSTITGVTSANVAYANAHIGATLSGTSVTIVSASGTTITFSGAVTPTGSHTYQISFPGNIQMFVGQTMTGQSLPAYVFTGTYTMGSNNITGCSSAAVAFAAGNPGCGILSIGLVPEGAVVINASGTTIIMSQPAIDSGTSGSGGYPDSGLVTASTQPFISAPTITKVYNDPVNTGVGYVEVDQNAAASWPNPSVATLAAFTIVGTFIEKLTLPTCRITTKLNPVYPVSIVTYRSAGGSTEVFYQVSSVISDPTVDTITIYDGLSDDVLAGGPGTLNSANQLYTAGGVLENSSGPPCTSLTTYQNRLVGIDTTNPLQLFYSQQVVPGSPVQFTEEFTINIDPRGGNCTALINMDDKLVIFKETTIFYMTGVGPNATGGANDFSDTFLVASDCGCTDPKSVVLMPNGVMFKSKKGIMLLNRALQVSYIGANVEGFNNYQVSSAQLIPTENQVRFSLVGTPTVLVFDYYYGLWGTFTNIGATCSVIFQNLFTWGDANGGVHQETPGVYNDNGAAIIPHFRTGWMSFAGLMGFQRVYKMLLLGKYISPHNLTVNVSYDFNEAVTQIDNVNVSTLIGTPFGDDAYFGQSTPFGGDPQTYLWRIFMQVQKTTSIRIDIVATPTAPIGEAVQFSGISFEVGVKPGVARLPAAKSSS